MIYDFFWKKWQIQQKIKLVKMEGWKRFYVVSTNKLNRTSKLETAILVEHFDATQEQLQKEEFAVWLASQAANEYKMQS